MENDRDESNSELFNITKGLLSATFGSRVGEEFENEYRSRMGDPDRSTDVSFFSGVGIAERVLAQREEVRQTAREAAPDENTVPSVRVNEVKPDSDGPTTALVVICSDPDAKFSLTAGGDSLELYSPRHDYTDPIRVPFDDAVLRVSEAEGVAEASVIDATTLPDAEPERDQHTPDSGVTERDTGRWRANGDGGERDE